MSDELLSTGLTSLDNSIEGGGLRPGSVVALRAPGRTVVRRLAINLCADRPVHYVTMGGDPSQYRPYLQRTTGQDGEDIGTETIPLGGPLEKLADHFDGLGAGLPEGTTVVVDPVTPLESLGDRAAALAVDYLEDVIEATGGLGIVLAVDAEGASPPPGRWVTTSRADAVLSITHRTTTDEVRHHLAVDRLPLGQVFRDDASRTFELPADLSMSLDTSKTLSP